MIGQNLIWAVVEPHLFAGFLLMLRMLGLVIMLPGMRAGSAPVPTRTLFVAFLTLFCYTAIGMPGVAVPLTAYSGIPMMAREFLLGASLGFGIRILFAVAESAGSIVAMSMALSMAGMVDPLTGDQSTAVSNLLAISGTLLFVTLGGHHAAVEGIMNNLALFPLGSDVPIGFDTVSLKSMANGLLIAAFQVAAPILIVTTLINVGLGLMARAAPQVNIFAVGFAVLLVAGMMLLETTLVALNEVYFDRVQVLSEEINTNLKGLY